jgi:hypothetical protein
VVNSGHHVCNGQNAKKTMHRIKEVARSSSLVSKTFRAGPCRSTSLGSEMTYNEWKEKAAGQRRRERGKLRRTWRMFALIKFKVI